MKVNNLMINTSNDLENKKSNKISADFGNYFKDYLNKVNEYEAQSQELEKKAAVGELDNIHEVMIAAQKSEVALGFMIEVKNKVLDAYKEIMRLQV
ncbi:flagellar hook-basal body complex protein FliE [Anaeromicrobium sediminis]|uniref:Flagellar hook-basal body complex protein FliE n=1 Tax=Anaeromicrobium sediminis TaxID=1478221 RepID=A0A267MP24_9FIRM|nr:flagellar hook-basal body complex protein FliE [Anaeromicrobium sediminis]PAB61276.1 flagellar hook-basal body complex protein FliE [Anaeromicrobium sediminis]